MKMTRKEKEVMYLILQTQNALQLPGVRTEGSRGPALCDKEK